MAAPHGREGKRWVAGLQRVHRGVFRRLLRNGERPGYTLDIDATQIVAAKREAHITYKGEGYMPMVGHIAETGLVIGHEFREGNAAPAAGSLEFLQACERNMPKGKKITAMRADSAAYQAAIFNYCEETGKVFAIGADRDAAVKAAIAAIPESAWKPFQDGEIAETVHCMNRTNNAFRLIVVRHPRDLDLFEDKSPYRYHAIASNRVDEDAARQWMVFQAWRHQREPHQGFEDRLRHGIRARGSFQANAVFFAVGALTYNLYLGFRSQALGSGWSVRSADRALAVVSDGGQDRPPWPADVPEDQRRHVGHVRRDPRALRAHHAGKKAPFKRPDQ